MTTETEVIFDPELIDSAFPLPTYRPGQREAIEFAVSAFNSGKRLVIIEAPTGAGKSPIGKCLSNLVASSYYLTVTKQLQDQATHDFPDLVELKGRNAYPCTWYERRGGRAVSLKLISPAHFAKATADPPNCATGFCRSHLSKSYCPSCFTLTGPDNSNLKGDLRELPQEFQYSTCPYYEQLYTAINSPQVIMNFSSFLYQTTMTRDRFSTRELMVVDEAHAIENNLMSFVTVSLSDDQLRCYNLHLPELEHAQDYAAWFIDQQVIDLITADIKLANSDSNFKLADELQNTLEKLYRFITAVSDETDEWISDYKSYNGIGSVTLKPVFVHKFSNPLLFSYGQKCLLLSATILDPVIMCQSLGIDRSQVATYRMTNRFPVKNRPIFVTPAAKVTGGKSAMGNWGPQLIAKINELATKYHNMRGIIHTHNFSIMELLINGCNPEVQERFLSQHNFKTKTDMLATHAQRNNSILIAPAMHEGIDLKDDLSRWQVVCKVPYPNHFEDRQLGRRVALDHRYYLWLTALKLVQSVGRSVRSETDWADTYIIDAAFTKFYNDTKSMLPTWFAEALCWK